MQSNLAGLEAGSRGTIGKYSFLGLKNGRLGNNGRSRAFKRALSKAYLKSALTLNRQPNFAKHDMYATFDAHKTITADKTRQYAEYGSSLCEEKAE